MKFSILVAAGLGIMGQAGQLLACAQALPHVRQKQEVEMALASEAYQAAIRTIAQREQMVFLVNIELNGGSPVRVNLSNNCHIDMAFFYNSPTHVGMCPQLDRIEAETVCQPISR